MPDVNTVEPTAITADISFMKWLYSEVRSYDLHYSTVRTGVSSFLIGIMFLMTTQVKEGGGAAQTVHYNLVVLIILVNLLMIYLNVHFQQLTAACKMYQSELERKLSRMDLSKDKSVIELPVEMVEVREYIQEKFRETSFYKAFIADEVAKMVVAGSYLYWVILITSLTT